MFAIEIMSRYIQKPKNPHLEVVRQILRYVKGTFNYALYT